MLKMRYVLVAALAVLPALGTTVTTSTFGAWDSSTYITGPVTYTSLNCSGTWSTSAGTTCSTYKVTGPDGTSSYYLTSQDYSQVQYDPTGLRSNQDGVGAVDVTLPGSGSTGIFIKAYAVHNGPTSDPVTLTLSNGFTTTFSGGGIGISSSDAITWFDLTQTSTSSTDHDAMWVYEVDTATGASQDPDPPQAPEAVTFALVGGGMLILFGAKRRFPNLTKFAS